MTAQLKQKIQLVLGIVIVLAAIRTGWIFYQRHEANLPQTKQQAPPLNPDYYITPKKLYPYDLKSAQEVTQGPVWVKVGYAVYYVPFNAGNVGFDHPTGMLLPLEKLQIEKVVKDGDQLMAVFSKDGKSYAFSIGTIGDGQVRFSGNDMLYYEDPHQLYSHWSADMWQAIDQHEIKPGMSELQACMAIGLGIPQSGGTYGNRTINYANGGHPVAVTFENGKAVEIKNETQVSYTGAFWSVE